MIDTIAEILSRIVMYCGPQGIELSIKTYGDENSFEFFSEPTKQFIIIIVDDTDENLPNQLENKFKELQEFFK